MTTEAKCRTLTEAYGRFGILVKNPRRLWSAQTDTGEAVVTLWSDLFTDADRRVCDVMDRPTDGWADRPENRRRIEHLKHARAKSGGIFNSIIVTQTGTTFTRIASVEIGPRMRLVKLDEHGRFRAERADR